MFLSVIIPCFNAERFLERTVRSLDAQTYKDFEVIIIDDGSTDGTLDLSKIIVESHNNYQVYSFGNAGLSEARNRGFERAQGEYVYFLDADDYLAPTMFQRMVDMIEANDGPDAVRCGALWVRDGFDEKKLPTVEINNNQVVIEGKELIDKITNSAIGYSENDVRSYYKTGQFPYNVDFSPVWIYFYKKSLLDTYNIRFVKGLQLIEDRIFNVTFAAYANKVVYTDDKLYYYIITQDGLMARINRDHVGLYHDKVEAVRQRENMRELYKKIRGIDIFSSYRGSNVMGCLQVALILADVPLKESIRMYEDYVNMPSVREGLCGFSLKGAPLKFKIPVFMIQNKKERLLLLMVRAAKGLIKKVGLRGVM